MTRFELKKEISLPKFGSVYRFEMKFCPLLGSFCLLSPLYALYSIEIVRMLISFSFSCLLSHYTDTLNLKKLNQPVRSNGDAMNLQ